MDNGDELDLIEESNVCLNDDKPGVLDMPRQYMVNGSRQNRLNVPQGPKMTVKLPKIGSPYSQLDSQGSQDPWVPNWIGKE